jgi:hypothetical protein
LTAEGQQIDRKDGHRLDVLVDELPDENPFKARLKPLGILTAFATTFRYPKDGGRLPKMPSSEEINRWLSALESIMKDVTDHFGVDVDASDDIPATTTEPPRAAPTSKP